MKKLFLLSVICSLISEIHAGSVVSGGGGSGASTSAANTWSALQTFSSGAAITGANSDDFLLLGSTATSGTEQLLRLRNNEAAAGDYGMSLGHNNGSNGATRKHHQLTGPGYNLPGPDYKVSDHSFYPSIESFWRGADLINQLEFYYVWSGNDGISGYRPFGMTMSIDTNASTAAFRTNQFIVGWQDTSNDWLKFMSTATTGDIVLTGNSTISYNGTAVDFIQSGSSGILGEDGDGFGRLFAGTNTANFFASRNYTSDTMTLTFGGFGGGATRGLRYVPGTGGWQMQDANGDWQNIAGAERVYDSSNNELLIFSKTASAVNEFTLANAAAGGTPTLSTTGAGTDIDMTFAPKGTARGIFTTASVSNTVFPLKVQGTAVMAGQSVGIWLSTPNSTNTANRGWGLATNQVQHGDLSTLMGSTTLANAPATIMDTLYLNGDYEVTLGNIKTATAGKGIQIKGGSNARIGQATLSTGAVTVSNTSVGANTRFILTPRGAGIGNVSLGTVTNATSFVILSNDVADARVVDWILMEQN